MRKYVCVLMVCAFVSLLHFSANICRGESWSFGSGGGFYAGARGGWGTVFHARRSVESDINRELQDAKRAGCFTIVQLEYNWRGEAEKSRRKLRKWLKRTDISLIDVLTFGEENPYNASAYLDPLYDEVKAKGNTAVYVWPSYPLGPSGKADGYVYDAYGNGYSSFRKRVVRFLKTGKPLIMCIDGSGYSDIRSAREQVMVCREFNIPVFYFVADSGSGSFNNWKWKANAPLVPWRNFVYSALEFQRRSGGGKSITASDMIWGEVIEIAGDYDGKINFAWEGIGSSTVYGFQRLKIDDGALQCADDNPVAMDYQFWSVLPVKDARLVLSVGSQSSSDALSGIKVERSRCGQLDEWKEVSGKYVSGRLFYELGKAGKEFRLRITLLGRESPPVRSFRLTGAVDVPKDRAIDLGVFLDGWRGIRFRQNLAVGLWRTLGQVDSPKSLEKGRRLAMRGKGGYGVSVNVVEKFTSAKPLEKIVIRLDGGSSRSLGGSFSLGVSLDGKKIIKKSKPLQKKGSYRGTLTLDLTDLKKFRGVREFYVHMNQSNGSGIRGNVSSSLKKLEIDAAIVK